MFMFFLSNQRCLRFFLCRGGMIQTGEQYEFVHHALNLFEARPPAETGQWACTAAGSRKLTSAGMSSALGVRLDLEILDQVFESDGPQISWLKWAEPVEGWGLVNVWKWNVLHILDEAPWTASGTCFYEPWTRVNSLTQTQETLFNNCLYGI